MSAGLSFPNALDGYFEEMALGRRGTPQSVVPDGDECDHICALLRRGVRSGIGYVMWDLRVPPGSRLDQSGLDAIAGWVREGHTSGLVDTVQEDGHPGAEAAWRICVRR